MLIKDNSHQRITVGGKGLEKLTKEINIIKSFKKLFVSMRSLKCHN